MATNLTGNKVKDTYNQLLHIDGGVEAAEKLVRSGTGTASALSLGTGSASVDNIKLDGNTISTLNTNGNLILAPNGAGAVQIANLQLGDLLLSGNTIISTGTNENIILAPNGNGDIQLNADTVRIGDENAAVTLTNWGATAGTLNITTAANNANIALTPHGTGEVQISKVAITAGTVPFNTVTNRAYASFYDAGTTDQSGSTTDRTAVKWATAAVTGAGITVASNSRITLAAAGTYRFNASIQIQNTDSSDHDATFWFAKNGTNIASSASKLTIPKTGDGGKAVFAIEIFEAVAANDYVEMYWYPENAAVTLHYIAAVPANPGVTPAIPIVPPAIVVVERVA